MERSAVLEIEQQQRLNEANTLLKQVTNDRLDRFQVLRFLRIWGLLKLGISLGFDKKYFGIIQGFQR